MTPTESRRLALFESARTSWGEPTAETLMDLLPSDPVQLAMKADLADLRADLIERMSDQTRLLMITMLTTTVTIMLAIAGAGLAAVAFD
jgi:hypothetical protein